MSRYQQDVNREYSKLTIGQLVDQFIKFNGSTVKHEQGKLEMTLKELRKRGNHGT